MPRYKNTADAIKGIPVTPAVPADGQSLAYEAVSNSMVWATGGGGGAVSAGFQVDFSSAPLPVQPGEYLHIILRCLGTNTTAGVPRGSVAIMGYFR